MEDELGDSVVDTGVQHDSLQESPEQDLSVDDYVAVDETSDSVSSEAFADRMRQRARETSQNNYRFLPKFDFHYSDTDDFMTEICEWFDYDDSNDNIFQELKNAFMNRFENGQWIDLQPDVKLRHLSLLMKDFKNGCSEVKEKALMSITYVAMGSYGEIPTAADHVQQIRLNCELLWKSGFLLPVTENVVQVAEALCPKNIIEDVEEPVTVNLDRSQSLTLTVFYFLIETLRDDIEFSDDFAKLETSILLSLVQVFSKLRWCASIATFPMKKLILIFWKSMLCLFGDCSQLSIVKAYTRKLYKLPETPDPTVITASPLEYHAFREDLTTRFPTYIPPTSILPKGFDNQQSLSHFIEIPRPAHTQSTNTSLPAPTVHISTPAPSPPASPAIAAGQKVRKSVFMTNQSFPFLYPSMDTIPQSIVEAGELFASRIKTTTGMMQLWDERERFMQFERGWVPVSNDKIKTEDLEEDSAQEQVILDRIEEFYAGSYEQLNSCVLLFLKLMLEAVSFAADSVTDTVRLKEIVVKGISASLLLMLRWLKVSHVLKFEYLSSILFDSRYYLVFYKYLYTYHTLTKALTVPDVEASSFFSQCRELSDCAAEDYGPTFKDYSSLPTPEEAQFRDHVVVYSSRYFHSLISMLKILRRIIKEKTQRIIVVGELPSDTLKKALTVYQKEVWKLVLDVFKEQVPFNGRKWKYSNMDLVSAIYLHCKTKLRDDWLVGTDAGAEVNDAYPQEVALRSLVQFYNDRMYTDKVLDMTGEFSHSMENSNENDIFAQEIEALSLDPSYVT